MTRSESFDRLAATSAFDLAVIGGGATGLGVALDAALRGYSVVLLESHDFAGGTSSRSTKLLHGGVRYLAQGNISLVREALAERSRVLAIAPHLAQPLAFVMPGYRWWQTPFYGLGLKVYDLLAGKAGLGPTQFLGRDATEQALPGVNPSGLRGGVLYWDGQFDDARLALAIARSAALAGALLFNHAEVMHIQRQKDHTELDVHDRITGQQCRVRATCVVNATGVWVDTVRQAAGTSSRMVRPSQGVHLVVDREFMPGQKALLVPKTRDGRVLFAVPWLGKLVLGTTDTPRENLDREPRPFEEELDFILSETSLVLSRPVRRCDVRSVWVGLRPLVAAPRGGEGGTQALSREHTIVVDDHAMLTVTGGKWTTYRAMADDVMQRLVVDGLLPRRGDCRTGDHRLFAAPSAARDSITAAPGPHLYGEAIEAVRALPGADRPLGMGLTEAMVRYAVREEYALTVEDVLARRWRALFLDAAKAGSMAPQVASLMTEEGVAHPQLDAFVNLCEQYQLAPSQAVDGP